MGIRRTDQHGAENSSVRPHRGPVDHRAKPSLRRWVCFGNQRSLQVLHELNSALVEARAGRCDHAPSAGAGADGGSRGGLDAYRLDIGRNGRAGRTRKPRMDPLDPTSAARSALCRIRSPPRQGRLCSRGMAYASFLLPPWSRTGYPRDRACRPRSCLISPLLGPDVLTPRAYQLLLKRSRPDDLHPFGFVHGQHFGGL